MNISDLARVESELQIELPPSYRESMCSFPIPACAGNSDTYLWDSADWLIRANLGLREGTPWRVPPWPSFVFFLGRVEGGTDAYAMDLRQPEGPIYWADHFHLDLPSGHACPSYSEWLESYVRGFRNDLELSGIDPDGSSGDREEVELANAREERRLLLFVILAAVVLICILFARLA